MHRPAQVSFFPPIYGLYPWWPEDGDAWIHPEDRHIARELLPGLRVFRRGPRRLGSLAVLSYGAVKFRVRPTMWLVVAGEGFDVGDEIEVMSRMDLNRSGIGTITEMIWDRRLRIIRYRVRRRGMRSERDYVADDLRHVDRICQSPTVRLEPPADDASDRWPEMGRLA